MVVEHWSQALLKEYGAVDGGGKQIHCIRKQGFAENEAFVLILP